MEKILLIDDDRVFQNLLKSFLELEGYSVDLSISQEKTDILQQIQSLQPDILILDVFMKNINGIQLLEEIRSLQTGQPAKVILTSGMPLKDDHQAVGANSFLLKPFMPDALISILKSEG